MKKAFKTAQRHIEHDLPLLKADIQTAAKLANKRNDVNETKGASIKDHGPQVAQKTNGADTDDTSKVVSNMLTKVRGLKRKLSAMKQEQDYNIESAKQRIQHLSNLYTIPTNDSPEFQAWCKRKLDILLVDYFLRRGYVETAKMHSTDRNIESLVDIKVLLQCSSIEKNLLNKQSDSCLNWCKENRANLRKVRSSLEFEVRLQHFIELVRNGRRDDAINYSRKHLAKSVDTQFPMMQQASALLAYPPSVNVSPYKELYSNERWTKLANLFVTTFYELNGIPAQSKLIENLAGGISSLKTYSCRKPRTEEDVLLNGLDETPVDLSKGHMCPICSFEFNGITSPLPYALHVRCHLDTDPVVLPNGRVYGRAKLIEYSQKAGVSRDKIADPTTREIFEFSEMKIIYPS